MPVTHDRPSSAHVGSVAALLQGAPITTEDMDILVRDTPKNREKLHQL